MKRLVLLLWVLMLAAGADARSRTVRFDVANNHNYTSDLPCLVRSVPRWARSVTVWADGVERPSQIDTIDGARVAAFTYDLGELRKANIKVRFDSKVVDHNYPYRVHSQMFLRTPDRKSIVACRSVSATRDTMYNWLHHHGPAFESELIGYRLYFDKKQTVDIYGKYQPGLELSETLWYPTDKQLADGAGDDVIRVYGSVGVGVLKGWNSQKRCAEHITPVARRTARIVASGAVRTVVEIEVEGWQYEGRTIGLCSRYTLWAGHRDVEVENTVSGDFEGLTFCTGVMKQPDHTAYIDRDRVAAWGTDFPVNDTVKFSRQSVGLVLYLPYEQRIETGTANRVVEDEANYLVLVAPDADGRIDYSFEAWPAKEQFGCRTKTEFEARIKE